MILHDNKELFQQAIRATAKQMQLKEIYIEKDYWVTYALYAIFHSEIGKQTVFKGGTALSKCDKLIERFSEDIDLVVIRSGEENDNQLKKKIKAISTVVNAIMPETEVEGITIKRGMNRKTAHAYPKAFKGDYGQVREVIIVEATWLGNFDPYTTKIVSSYIYEMMLDTGQQKMIEKYGLLPFDVQVLTNERTICEKIMSLVRFSHTANPIEGLRKKIRHTYDLHQLLQNTPLLNFFHSADFEALFLRVANDDLVSYRNNNDWLVHHPSQALIFRELESTWSQLESIYLNDFKALVYGKLPKPQDVFATLESIKERLAKISWDIDFPKE